MAMTPAIFVLTASARRLGSTLASHLEGSLIEPEDFAGELRWAFDENRPIIGICAAGILIRLLAAKLSDKHTEPPVIAVAEDGSSAVPLLGGHHGANDLARRIAEITGGTAAITTASDLRFGVNLDEPRGYTLANPANLKGFLASLLAGHKVRAKGEAPWLSSLPLAADAELSLLVTDYAVPGSEKALVYHPRRLTVGVGCERGVSLEDLMNNIDDVFAKEGLAKGAVACVATLDVKADEPAVHSLAAHLGVPSRFFSADELNAEAPRLRTPSPLVLREVGCPGVAEAAALRAAGTEGELVIAKTIRSRTTCAVARAAAPIDPLVVGRARGSLTVVGVGPGSSELRTQAALAALRRATDWVGYELYLDLIADLRQDHREHRFPLGDERTRVLHALHLAGEGRDVAIVCSGDPGIYAMASLVCEIFDPASGESLSEAQRRIAVTIVPGISAFQAGAARVGGFIGHDFCAISLSDLLTPWHVIEKRVLAAAEGDFVVAFYNPRSLKRSDHLSRAMAILKAHRHSSTPVVIARNLGRQHEQVATVPLAEFSPAEVDMLSLVLIGARSSRSFLRGDGTAMAYTPRGYASKRETPS
jgi:cobalt-precorrin 5A hydrolase / precorrin-3B C17-methyltransferase